MDKVKKMINMLGTSKSGKLKDSDGDGYADVIDCKPHNKHKQGWVHDQIESYKKVRAERKEQRYVETTKADEAAKEERIRQATKTAVYKEQQRGEKQREYVKSGGFAGQISRSFAQPSPVRRAAPVRRKSIVRKVRSGVRKSVGVKKKAVTRYVTKRRTSVRRAAQPSKPAGLFDNIQKL